MQSTNLDMDVLRTLALAGELGSFRRAALRVGRSQSAVSQQLRRLEDQVGERLFRKHGRGLLPTAAGEVLLTYARRILGLNDEAIAAVRGHAVEALVRFGLPSDFAESWLPAALGRFKRAHPAIRIEAVVDRNRRLLERLDDGALDLVLALGNAARADAHRVATLPYVWIAARTGEPVYRPGEPVPLAVFEAPCFFRQAAQTALDRRGIAWRIAFVSSSLHGLWAAIEAGLGVTLRTEIGLPAGVAALPRTALPQPTEPPIDVALHDGGRQLGTAATQLRAIVLDELARGLDGKTLSRARRTKRQTKRRR